MDAQRIAQSIGCILLVAERPRTAGNSISDQLLLTAIIVLRERWLPNMTSTNYVWNVRVLRTRFLIFLPLNVAAQMCNDLEQSETIQLTDLHCTN